MMHKRTQIRPIALLLLATSLTPVILVAQPVTPPAAAVPPAVAPAPVTTAAPTSPPGTTPAPAPATPPGAPQAATPAPASPADPAQAAATAATSVPTGTLPLAPVTIEKADQTTSMGKSGISIFFTPLQIRAMESALHTFESKPVSATPQPQANLEVDLLQLQQQKEPEQIKIVEPDKYPVFYLSSIAYRDKKEWSIWVSGHKITSDKNNTDLEVTGVSNASASFRWKPKFSQALNTRKTQNAFAPTDSIKTKLSKTQPMKYEPESGTLTFTLRTNQTLAVGYMNIFEGFVESPALPKIETPQAKPGDTADNQITHAPPPAASITTQPAPAPPPTPNSPLTPFFVDKNNIK